MAALYVRDDVELALGGGAAALTLGGGFAAGRSDGFGSRSIPRPQFDLVVDLGARIGSREWWRGLATCTALCATAIALRPSSPELVVATPVPLAAGQWQEARAIAIAPLGLGADTGRRMGSTDAVRPLADIPERPSIDLSATLGQGDGFARVLERSGVSSEEARRVSDMVAGAVALPDVKSGTRLAITLGRRANRRVARPLDNLQFRARFDLALGVERIDGQLRLRRMPIAVDNTPLRIQGRVGSSLYSAARAAGASPKAIETYLRALSQRLSIGRDVKSDDRFDLIIEQRRAATGEVEVGQLLYAGLDQGRKQTRLLKWTQGKAVQWFEASGVGEKKGVMRMPVVGRLTSSFGLRRHPILGFSRFHRGQDFGAPHGAPIVAAVDGRVTFAGRHGGHGNYIMIDHGGGLKTAYAHLSRFAARPGERVTQGEVIGYVGSTGLSTGPHLHYEVYRNGQAINPRSISFVQTAQLAGVELARFKSTLGRLLSVKPGAAASPLKTAAVKATPTG